MILKDVPENTTLALRVSVEGEPLNAATLDRSGLLDVHVCLGLAMSQSQPGPGTEPFM